MIIVNLFGGLGNQMFQYSFGKALSHKLNVEVKFDNTFNLTRTDFRAEDIPFVYDIFDIDVQIVTARQIEQFKYKNPFKRKLYHMLGINNIVAEKHFHFDEGIFNISDNMYLTGYWQSEKYFDDIKEDIYLDFQYKQPILEQNIKYKTEIESTNSISIHLRGRDYLNNKEHFTCDKEYYIRAIEILKTKFSNFHLFVFSDDPEWAKSVLSDNVFDGIELTFVAGNDWNQNNHEDMRLMSLCKHNIIANSSFSWWGAWLNRNNEKIVIAPKKWFNTSDKNTSDIVPGGWFRV